MLTVVVQGSKTFTLLPWMIVFNYIKKQIVYYYYTTIMNNNNILLLQKDERNNYLWYTYINIIL